MSTPASVVIGATAGGPQVASAVPVLTATGVQLPATGTGGGPAVSSSMLFLMVMAVFSALSSAALYLMGHRQEFEDDGIREE